MNITTMCKQITLVLLFLVLEQASLSWALFVSNREEIMLVPSVAFRSHSSPTELRALTQQSDDWTIHVQGWFFKSNPFRATLSTSLLSTVVDDVDEERVSYFTASGKRYKQLCIEGLRREMCAKTDEDGLFEKQFQVSDEDMQRFRLPGGTAGKVEYSVSTVDRKHRSKGEIFLCDDNGISIISDIDDTIKITGVTSARAVVRNTFAGVYKSVPGMPERYRHYQSIYNATFHYLTASPDQLYPFLHDFFQREQFPSGSFHMRHFTWFDKNFFEFFASKSFVRQKTNILEMFFEQTRARRFILFGDIFQKDPEIYAHIYEKYAERILKIFIRLPTKKVAHRLDDVFAHIPTQKWATFVTGNDLPERIFEK